MKFKRMINQIKAKWRKINGVCSRQIELGGEPRTFYCELDKRCTRITKCTQHSKRKHFTAPLANPGTSSFAAGSLHSSTYSCGNSGCRSARLQAPTANIGKVGTVLQARGNASPAMREGARRQSPAGANFEPRQARQAPNGHRQVWRRSKPSTRMCE